MSRPRTEVDVRRLLTNEVARIKRNAKREQEIAGVEADRSIAILQQALNRIIVLEEQLRIAQRTITDSML